MWNITGTFLVNWRFMLQFQWAAPLNFPVMWQWSLAFYHHHHWVFTYPAHVTRLKLFFFFFSHDQILVKKFFHYFFTVFILFKNCFNKFRSCIFTSKNNYWFTKFIINTNKFVSKTTRNIILVFFCVRTFLTLNTL